jgi:hypothetical protein
MDSTWTRDAFKLLGPKIHFGRWNLVFKQIPNLVEEINAKQSTVLSNSDSPKILLLDGWTDVSKRNLHAVMIKTGTEKIVKALFEMPAVINSAENIVSQLKDPETLGEESLKEMHAICTDSPTVMQSVRSKLSSEFENIISVPCCCHILNLVAHDVVHDLQQTSGESRGKRVLVKTVKKLTDIIKFFNGSDYWREFLRQKQQELKIKHGIVKFSKSRWYGVSILCKSIIDLEAAFDKCVEEHNLWQRKPRTNRKEIVSGVLESLKNKAFYCNAREVEVVISLISEAIASLETDNASIADVYIIFLRLYKQLKDLVEDEYPNTFAQKGLTSLNLRVEKFIAGNDIFLLATTLYPRFKNLLQCPTGGDDRKKKVIKMAANLLRIWKPWNERQKTAESILEDLIVITRMNRCLLYLVSKHGLIMRLLLLEANIQMQDRLWSSS